MLRKIKKARDLVFTTSKRRSRRQAVASQDTARDHEVITKQLYDTKDDQILMTEPKDSAVFDSVMQNDYKSPLDMSRIKGKAKPWQNATSGRYKDLFNLHAHSPRESDRTRPMRMSPDLDFRVDRRDRQDEYPMGMAEIER